MICKNCGEEVPKDAHFCVACGAYIENEEEKKNQEILQYVERNTEYFSEEFIKTRQCIKPKFNWAAFWVSLPYCIYRKQYSIIKTYLLIPMILGVLVEIIWSIYLFLSIHTMDIMSLMTAESSLKWIKGAIGVWSLIASILVGKKFNCLYYESLEHVYEVRNEIDIKKHTGVSVRNVWIFIFVCVIYGGIIGPFQSHSMNQILGITKTQGVGNHTNEFLLNTIEGDGKTVIINTGKELQAYTMDPGTGKLTKVKDE